MAAPEPQEYLAATFDPSTLRIPQLRSILLAHGVGAPATARKADLVAQFEITVRPRAAELINAASRIKPSSKGIVQIGEDGESVSVDSTPPAPAVPVKRGRGRPRKHPLPVAPAVLAPPVVVASDGAEADDDEIVPRPTRGRKSVPATPSRVTRRSSTIPSSLPIQAEVDILEQDANGNVVLTSIVAEEIEVEDDEQEGERKSKVGKIEEKSTAPETSRASAAAASAPTEVKTPRPRGRPRKSAPATVPNAEESGFSDYNPFQSGGEGREEKKRRKSTAASAASRRQTIAASDSKGFRSPEASPAASSPALRKFQPSLDQLKTPPKDVKDAIIARQSPQEKSYEEYNNAVHAKLNQLSSKDLSPSPAVVVENDVGERTVAVRDKNSTVNKIASPRSAIPLSLILVTLLTILANYKSQSASIGYCDTALPTNSIIADRAIAHRRAKECIARRAAITMGERGDGYHLAMNEQCDPSALPLIPFIPRPDSCAVCPPHAVCEHGEIIACEPEFLLVSNPLKPLSPVLDGLPGLGPRAVPDQCKPDTVKRRLIGGLARELEADLAKGRGSVICAGLGGKVDDRAGEGERYGLTEQTLIERFAARRDPKFSHEQFQEVFEAALKDLVEHGDVIESIDVHGTSFYAAARAEIPLGCRAKLAVKDQVEAWKSQLSATMVVIASLAAARSAQKARAEEKRSVDELVKQVLTQLQEQERQHYVDPVTTPQPFIPPPQLRDQLLASSGLKNRNAIWRKVVSAVEANANVSSREREINGEVWSTWQWQGRHISWE